MSATAQPYQFSRAAVTLSIRRCAEALLRRRLPEGHWRGAVDGGVSASVEYLLLWRWREIRLGQGAAGKELCGQVAKFILSRQGAHGGFGHNPEGEMDLDLSVRAYVALRLYGMKPDNASLHRCRRAILEAGGLRNAGALARLDLSFLGLLPRSACVSVPVELMLFRRRWLEPLAGWAIAAAVPLAIVQHLNGEPEAPEEFSTSELIAGGEDLKPQGAGWLRWWFAHGPGVVKSAALGRAEVWLLTRIRRAEPLQSTFPAIRYSLMALSLLGDDGKSPEMRSLEGWLEDLVWEDNGRTLVQPFTAPVRDTALAVRSIDEANAVPGIRFQRTADWLVEEQITSPDGERGYWPFRTGDTAMVLLGLQRMEGSDLASQNEAVRKAIRWLLGAQAADGGWASLASRPVRFRPREVTWIEKRFLTDYSSPGATGLVLEAICRHGLNGRDPAVRRGVRYLIDCQNLDGSWIGSWTGSYIGATCLAVSGLAAAGEDPHEPHMLRAGEWIRSVQNADGGWGENPDSFHAKEYAPGASSAVQTARALIGLIESGDAASDSVAGGVEYLLRNQGKSGEWQADGPTGTWQAGAFQIHADLDRICYPLLALARYQNVGGDRRGETT